MRQLYFLNVQNTTFYRNILIIYYYAGEDDCKVSTYY